MQTKSLATLLGGSGRPSSTECVRAHVLCALLKGVSRFVQPPLIAVRFDALTRGEIGHG
jgi:hypothetical protein